MNMIVKFHNFNIKKVMERLWIILISNTYFKNKGCSGTSPRNTLHECNLNEMICTIYVVVLGSPVWNAWL